MLKELSKENPTAANGILIFGRQFDTKTLFQNSLSALQNKTLPC